MPTRRHLLQMSFAAATGIAFPRVGSGQDRFDQAALLGAVPFGNLTVLHLSDLRGQLAPAYFRPTDRGIGAIDLSGDIALSGEALRIRYGIGGGTPMDYALTHENFEAHARAYGPMGGLAHVATVVGALRAKRPDLAVLAGGVTHAGGAAGRTVAEAMTQMGALAGAGAPEKQIIYGSAHLKTEKSAAVAVLRQSETLRDAMHQGEVSPRDLQKSLARQIAHARAGGARGVILMSHLGIEVDQALARDVAGLDLILSGHSHVALPEPITVGGTRIIASGGQGQFVGKLDLQVTDNGVQGMRHRLIPVFSHIIDAHPHMQRIVGNDPSASKPVLTRAGGVLDRGGAVTARWDRLICDALLAGQDADIAVVPGYRWGPAVLPGQGISKTDIQAVIPRNAALRHDRMTGAEVIALLETAAETAFSGDPYRRDGLDMVRIGGLGLEVNPGKSEGDRIRNLRFGPQRQSLDPKRVYRVVTLEDAAGTGDRAAVIGRIMQYVTRRKPLTYSASRVRAVM